MNDNFSLEYESPLIEFTLDLVKFAYQQQF